MRRNRKTRFALTVSFGRRISRKGRLKECGARSVATEVALAYHNILR